MHCNKKKVSKSDKAKNDNHPLASQDVKLLVDFFGLLYEWDCKQKKESEEESILDADICRCNDCVGIF